jgi:hypothetical protein
MVSSTWKNFDYGFLTKKNQNQFQIKTSFDYLNQTLSFFALGEF